MQFRADREGDPAPLATRPTAAVRLPFRGDGAGRHRCVNTRRARVHRERRPVKHATFVGASDELFGRTVIDSRGKGRPVSPSPSPNLGGPRPSGVGFLRASLTTEPNAGLRIPNAGARPWPANPPPLTTRPPEPIRKTVSTLWRPRPPRGHVDRIVADASGPEPATNVVVARTTTTVTLKLNGAIECTTSESLDRSEGVSA